MNVTTRRHSGSSVIDVVIMVLTVALVITFVLPLLARPGRHCHSPRIRCVNNLRQVGIANRIYANDHLDQFPFKVSHELSGTLSFTNPPQVYWHFRAMSNELNTPRVLSCPADEKRCPASNFMTLSNTNISYFVNVDADESRPQGLLSGDRNIVGGSRIGSLRIINPTNTAGWTTELHNRAGNVGLSDGSAQQVDSPTLQRYVRMQTNNSYLAIP